MPSGNEEHAHTFLTELWGENPGNGKFIQVWDKARGKKNYYFPTALKAARQVTKGDAVDLYVGVSLASKDYGPAKRAPAKESAGIPGLWADIDINGGPESKTGAARDHAEAAELAFQVLEPTLLINSGYGLQAWWLFDDGPWIFGSAEEREQAARMSAGWIQLMRQKATAMGFGIDATQDLARLMRLPGTFNGKGGLSAPVKPYYEAGEYEGTRHSRDSLAELAASAGTPATATRDAIEGIVGEFTINPGAEPPLSRFQAAQANSPMFIRTLEHTRRGPGMENWSLSEWDLSLASQAAHLDWTDQEIVDLIIYHRRKHGEVEKATRPDYLRNTIGRARRERTKTQTEKRTEAALENLAVMGTEEAPDPAAVMAEFNAVINSTRFKVKELVQDGDDPKQARYRIIIEPGGQEVPIGPASTLFNPDSFREAFGVVTGHVVMPVKRAEWLAALQALLNVRQVNVNVDDTPAGQVVEWLGRYIGERAINDQTEACRAREPFEKDGYVYVYAGSFETFVSRSLGKRVTGPDLKQMLKAASFTTKVVSYHKEDGKASSRSYYYAPKDVLG